MPVCPNLRWYRLRSAQHIEGKAKEQWTEDKPWGENAKLRQLGKDKGLRGPVHVQPNMAEDLREQEMD
jgi:hypothetical protein